MRQSEEIKIKELIEQLLDRSSDEDKEHAIIREIRAKHANALPLLLFYWVDRDDLPDSNETLRQRGQLEKVLKEFYQRDKWQALQSLLLRTTVDSRIRSKAN